VTLGIRHGAAAVKTRAMYGRRLKAEDFKTLRSLRNVPDAAAFLKAHPAWGPALETISPAEAHRGPLEGLLKNAIIDEYGRIVRFVATENHPLSNYPYIRYEMDQIMGFLRLLRTGRPREFHYYEPAGGRGKVDFDALGSCTDYKSFLDVIRNSHFYETLARIPTQDDGMPDYTATDLAVHNRFYESLIDMAKKDYGGRDREAFTESLLLQTDMINITRAFRLRGFFPRGYDASGYMIPAYGYITPTFLKSLAAAPDDATAYTLLKASRRGRVFAENNFSIIESYYFKAMYDFNKRRYREGAPSAYTPFAYLYLKELELRQLINTIECIRYGRQFHNS